MDENQTIASNTDATGSTIEYSYVYPTTSDYEMRKDALIQAVNSTYAIKGPTDTVIDEKVFMARVEAIYEFLSKGKNN